MSACILLHVEWPWNLFGNTCELCLYVRVRLLYIRSLRPHYSVLCCGWSLFWTTVGSRWAAICLNQLGWVEREIKEPKATKEQQAADKTWRRWGQTESTSPRVRIPAERCRHEEYAGFRQLNSFSRTVPQLEYNLTRGECKTKGAVTDKRREMRAT